jgi:hypothetical protein
MSLFFNAWQNLPAATCDMDAAREPVAIAAKVLWQTMFCGA